MKLAPTIVIDRREQDPFEFANLPATRGTLETGDYSVVGLEHIVTVERKNLDDLLACCGAERDRFVRELQRIRALEFRAVVVEASLANLECGGWRSRLKPAHVLGSIASWQARYCPFILAGDHQMAGRWCERFLFQAARAVAERYSAACALLRCADIEAPRLETAEGPIHGI